jgi:hypothetical protein
MVASVRANLPTKSLCARRVIDLVSGEAGKHPSVKSLKLPGMRCTGRLTTTPPSPCLILKEAAQCQIHADCTGFGQVLIQE